MYNDIINIHFYSWYIAKIFVKILKKISGAIGIPNSSLKNRKCPNGVAKVASFEARLFNFVCQNPLFAFNTVKYYAPTMSCIISSKIGKLKCSLRNVAFNSFRFKQTQI